MDFHELFLLLVSYILLRLVVIVHYFNQEEIKLTLSSNNATATLKKHSQNASVD